MGPSENTKLRASPKNAARSARNVCETTPPTKNPHSVSTATSVGPASSHPRKNDANEAPFVFELNTRRHFVRQSQGIERDRNHAERG